MKLRNKNTGDIDDFYLEDDINVDTGEHWICVIRTHKHHDMTNSWHFRTLKELYGNFEDYEPKEPLIKDEKIRKAVRAWAEANVIRSCICKEEMHCITFETERGMFISFEYAVPIPPEGNYTIKQLCGEEE